MTRNTKKSIYVGGAFLALLLVAYFYAVKNTTATPPVFIEKTWNVIGVEHVARGRTCRKCKDDIALTFVTLADGTQEKVSGLRTDFIIGRANIVVLDKKGSFVFLGSIKDFPHPTPNTFWENFFGFVFSTLLLCLVCVLIYRLDHYMSYTKDDTEKNARRKKIEGRIDTFEYDLDDKITKVFFSDGRKISFRGIQKHDLKKKASVSITYDGFDKIVSVDPMPA